MKNTVMMKLALASGIASTIFALAPICGNASDFGVASKAVVRYLDLDLTTEAGARTLFRRLMKAANEVCPVDENTHYRNRIEHTCVYATMTTAVGNLNSPALSKLYASWTGVKVATHVDEPALAVLK